MLQTAQFILRLIQLNAVKVGRYTALQGLPAVEKFSGLLSPTVVTLVLSVAQTSVNFYLKGCRCGERLAERRLALKRTPVGWGRAPEPTGHVLKWQAS